MRHKAWALAMAVAVFVVGVVWLRVGGSDSDFVVYGFPAIGAVVVGVAVYSILRAVRG